MRYFRDAITGEPWVVDAAGDARPVLDDELPDAEAALAREEADEAEREAEERQVRRALTML